MARRSKAGSKAEGGMVFKVSASGVGSIVHAFQGRRAMRRARRRLPFVWHDADAVWDDAAGGVKNKGLVYRVVVTP